MLQLAVLFCQQQTTLSSNVSTTKEKTQGVPLFQLVFTPDSAMLAFLVHYVTVKVCIKEKKKIYIYTYILFIYFMTRPDIFLFLCKMLFFCDITKASFVHFVARCNSLLAGSVTARQNV